MTRKRFISLLVAGLVMFGVAPASSAPALKVLGTDPELDAAPSYDLTTLSVRKAAKDLEIHIGINGMTPPWGVAIPYLSAVEWTFDVKGRTFIAEAYSDPTSEPGYLLFEKKDDAFTQLMDLTGTHNWEDGFVSIKVPLKKIGARSGTRISGSGNADDVDYHIHHAGTDYFDYLTTKKDFVVP